MAAPFFRATAAPIATPAPVMPAMNQASRLQLRRGRMLQDRILAGFMLCTSFGEKVNGLLVLRFLHASCRSMCCKLKCFRNEMGSRDTARGILVLALSTIYGEGIIGHVTLDT